MKKLNIMNVKKDVLLNRNELKAIIAGSGGSGSGSSTNWIFCAYESTFCEACATYNGSSPYLKCSQVCGDWPQNASWGTAQNCSDGGWG